MSMGTRARSVDGPTNPSAITNNSKIVSVYLRMVSKCYVQDKFTILDQPEKDHFWWRIGLTHVFTFQGPSPGYHPN